MKELWQNEQSRAGISLALWGVFIFGLLIVGIITGRNGTNISEPAIKEEKIENPFKSLVKSSNSFMMVVEPLDHSTKKTYDVTIINGNEYEGYVEDSKGINRFRCDNKCYKVFLDHEEEDTSYYDELVTNIEILSSSSFTISKIVAKEKNADVNYNSYNVEKDDMLFTFVMDDSNNVIKAVIESNNNFYTFINDKELFE